MKTTTYWQCYYKIDNITLKDEMFHYGTTFAHTIFIDSLRIFLCAYNFSLYSPLISSYSSQIHLHSFPTLFLFSFLEITH